jgi:hypothetical protein
MVHYDQPQCGVNPTPISGPYLSRNWLSTKGRARLAVGLYRRTKQLIEPTMVQAAWLARVSTASAWLEYKRQAEHAAIQAGRVSAVAPQQRVVSEINGTTHPATLPPDEINDAELVNIAQQVGVDRMLQAAMAAELHH